MIECDKIYNEECIAGMRQIPDRTIDLIVTDPPYDFKNKHKSEKYNGAGAFGKTGRTYHSELDSYGMIGGYERESFVNEARRVMKKVNLYLFCSKDQIVWYLNAFKDCYFELLTWHKTNPIPTCSNKYLSDTEYLLFFREKGVQINGTYQTKRKWWVQPANTTDKRIYNHPTIKPLNIIRSIIINSSNEGDIVLDPFIGSGTTAVACISEKRRYIGFEINKEFYETAQRRISKL